MLIKRLDNYKILFSLRLLKSILNSFVEVFLVLYFLKVSNSNILPLGIYKLVAVTALFSVMLCTRNYCKSNKRIILLRIGVILFFIYFLAIILLKEKIVDYIYLVGLIYGLEEGFFYSVFNVLETDSVENSKRARYIGFYTLITNIISILFPLIFGGIIQKSGFLNAIIFALFIVTIQIILSTIYKDKNVPKENKTDFKKFKEIIKEKPEFKSIAFSKLCDGLTYSDGALSYVITIYIIKVFSESMSLGIFTSIFSIISALIGLLFAKVIKPKQYNFLMASSSIMAILFLCWMLIDCNFLSIVLYNLFHKISRGLTDLINERNVANFANISVLKKEYKIEYFLSTELFLFIGRAVSNSLFILMAFCNANLIMAIFVIFTILRAISCVLLQSNINKNKELHSEKVAV